MDVKLRQQYFNFICSFPDNLSCSLNGREQHGNNDFTGYAYKLITNVGIMRIWSLHPKHLDARGLVALWRETLLAKHVLEGKTKGYRHHPQLTRFRQTDDPTGYINRYLIAVYEEALARGYRFNRDKIGPLSETNQLAVTSGQIGYETRHLLGKLKVRDPVKYEQLFRIRKPHPHPLFRVVEGEIETWEIQ